MEEPSFEHSLFSEFMPLTEHRLYFIDTLLFIDSLQSKILWESQLETKLRLLWIRASMEGCLDGSTKSLSRGYLSGNPILEEGKSQHAGSG